VIHALKIQRSHSGENSFTEWAGRAAAACLGSPGRFSPALSVVWLSQRMG